MKGLNELNIDEEAVVTASLPENRRLRDLGVVAGAKIKCVLKSPLGDPAAYEIRGAVVAIRKKDSARIMVEARNDG